MAIDTLPTKGRVHNVTFQNGPGPVIRPSDHPTRRTRVGTLSSVLLGATVFPQSKQRAWRSVSIDVHAHVHAHAHALALTIVLLRKSTSAAYFSDGSLLAGRLLRILSVALETNDDASAVQDFFAVILEASLHSRAVWDAFINNADTPRLLQILLLTDQRRSVREHIAKKIASVCGGAVVPAILGNVADKIGTRKAMVVPLARVAASAGVT